MPASSTGVTVAGSVSFDHPVADEPERTTPAAGLALMPPTKQCVETHSTSSSELTDTGSVTDVNFVAAVLQRTAGLVVVPLFVVATRAQTVLLAHEMPVMDVAVEGVVSTDHFVAVDDNDTAPPSVDVPDFFVPIA